MAGLRELEETNPDIQLYAISVEGPELQRKFKEQIAADGEGEFPWTMLRDEGSRVIDEYRLRDPAYAGTENDGLPHPAVFVLDDGGRIVWSRVETDYRERPSLDEIREAIDRVETEPDSNG